MKPTFLFLLSLCLCLQTKAASVTEVDGEKVVLLSEKTVVQILSTVKLTDATTRRNLILEALQQEAMIDGSGKSFCELAGQVYQTVNRNEQKVQKRCQKVLVSKDLYESLVSGEELKQISAPELQKQLSAAIALFIVM